MTNINTHTHTQRVSEKERVRDRERQRKRQKERFAKMACVNMGAGKFDLCMAGGQLGHFSRGHSFESKGGLEAEFSLSQRT